MWPNRVSNPGPLTYETYESGALPIALRSPAVYTSKSTENLKFSIIWLYYYLGQTLNIVTVIDMETFSFTM